MMVAKVDPISPEGCRHGSPSGSSPRNEIDRFLAEPTRANVPRCPACGCFIRQHALWFDETYDSHDDYQWDRVVQAAFAAETVLFIGTSFSVGVTERVTQAAWGHWA